MGRGGRRWWLGVVGAGRACVVRRVLFDAFKVAAVICFSVVAPLFTFIASY